VIIINLIFIIIMIVIIVIIIIVIIIIVIIIIGLLIRFIITRINKALFTSVRILIIIVTTWRWLLRQWSFSCCYQFFKFFYFIWANTCTYSRWYWCYRNDWLLLILNSNWLWILSRGSNIFANSIIIFFKSCWANNSNVYWYTLTISIWLITIWTRSWWQDTDTLWIFVESFSAFSDNTFK